MKVEDENVKGRPLKTIVVKENWNSKPRAVRDSDMEKRMQFVRVDSNTPNPPQKKEKDDK